MRRHRLATATALARAVLAAVTIVWAIDATVAFVGAIAGEGDASPGVAAAGLAFSAAVWAAGSAFLVALARIVPPSTFDDPKILWIPDDAFVPPRRRGPPPRR